MRTNSVFTKYLGGKFISFYTVTVVLSSLVLMGVTLANFVLFYSDPLRNSLQYVSKVSIALHASKVSDFMSSIEGMKSSVESGTGVSALFSSHPSLLSVTSVPDSISSSYRVTNTSGILASNANDCATSTAYTCDLSEYVGISDIRQTPWYLGATSSQSWQSPAVYLRNGAEIVNHIDLVWTVSSAVYRIKINATAIPFSSDPFLDNSGVGNIWLINKSDKMIVSGNGISPTTFVSIGSGGELTSLSASSLGGWLAVVASGLATQTVFENIDGGISAAASDISGTPYSLLVGSSAYPFDHEGRMQGFLLSELVVAVLPIVASVLVGSAYLLRLVAIQRRRTRREEEVLDAQAALRAIQESKVRSGKSFSKSVTSPGVARKDALVITSPIRLLSQRSDSSKK